MISRLNFDTEPEGDVVNGLRTFAAITDELRKRGRIFIGWTDRIGTHYEILFTLAPSHVGLSMMGMRGPGTLFVSVLRRGCFGFHLRGDVSDLPLSAAYVAEKLNLEEGRTAAALAQLVSGVLGLLAFGMASAPADLAARVVQGITKVDAEIRAASPKCEKCHRPDGGVVPGNQTPWEAGLVDRTRCPETDCPMKRILRAPATSPAASA